MLESPYKIDFYPVRTVKFLSGITGLLLIVHISIGLLNRDVDTGFTRYLKRLFYLEMENNIPTFFSVCLWLFNAFLFSRIGISQQSQGSRAGTWRFLACIFWLLAFDEFGSIHEQTIPYLQGVFSASGCLHFAWVIPYGIGLLFMVAFMIPTFRKLDRHACCWYGAATITFAAGAIGLEMLAGLLLETVTMQHMAYFWLVTCEETLEMAGLVMLAYASSLTLAQRER